MIEVRLFATLPELSARGRKHLELEARPGLTVRTVLESEGLPQDAVRIVMLNGHHAGLEDELHDGDRLGLFPPVGGG
jgi:sulfur-carrier protein